MTQDGNQPDHHLWPPFFLPAPGQGSEGARAATDERLRIPATLIDLFYLQSPITGAFELTAVAGCLGGSILVVSGALIPTLSDDLQIQIKTVEVNCRGIFRAIFANEVYVACLDAVEQDVKAQGFNDAIYIFSRMQARLAAGQPVQLLTSQGRLTVGRFDLLHAYRQSLDDAFPNLLAPDEAMYHLLLPAAPLHALQHGYGLVLVYPLLDPMMISGADNSYIVMRLVYEVLVRFQQDMIDAGLEHSFCRLVLPVPSRDRLETELAADGYAINGDYAARQTRSDDPQQGTFIARLRQLARHWNEPNILLPAQATPQDYRDIIDDLLASVGTADDQAMAAALSATLRPNVSAQQATPTTVQPARPNLVEPVAAPTIPQQPSAQHEWLDDFGVKPASAEPPTLDTFADDLSFSSAGRPTVKLVDSEARRPEPDEWASDFPGEADQRRQKPRPVNTDTPEQTPPADDWSKDF